MKFAYAWKLTSTDKTPAGKRDGISLREKEKEIQKDLDDKIDTSGAKMTVCELYAMQARQRANVRYSTMQGRARLMRLLEADRLGSSPIGGVKPSDAKEWALRMKENGVAYQTIRNDKRSLKAAFYMAMQDGFIRNNPFDFSLGDVIGDDSKPKAPLTKAQEESLLSFLGSDPVYGKYLDEVRILLGTGLRVSELCGLTEGDLDFENGRIRVDHQLLRNKEKGFYIEKPKTPSGIREIPMAGGVCQALKRTLESRKRAGMVTIDGYNGFLFLNQNGRLKTASTYDRMFRGLVKKYNKCHKETPLGNVTPHTLRHTFCTNLANAGMNPKALQYIMGHSNITMTLGYYAHVSFDSVKVEMERVMG